MRENIPFYQFHHIKIRSEELCGDSPWLTETQLIKPGIKPESCCSEAANKFSCAHDYAFSENFRKNSANLGHSSSVFCSLQFRAQVFRHSLLCRSIQKKTRRAGNRAFPLTVCVTVVLLASGKAKYYSWKVQEQTSRNRNQVEPVIWGRGRVCAICDVN